MFVTTLGHYPIVLGIPWLWLHDVAVRYASNTVAIGSQHCTTYCHDSPVTVKGVTEELPVPVYRQEEGIFEWQIRRQCQFRGNNVMLHGSLFFWIVRKGKLTDFNASLYDINTAIESKDLKERPLEEIILEQYYDFLPLFNEILADHVPPHRPGIDHEVRLKEGKTATSRPLHSMSREELVTLKNRLEEDMSKELIPHSSSPFATPVLFAKTKPGGELRFCIDYCNNNSETIKNWYPLPSLRETQNLLQRARIYTKLDVCAANILLRVKGGDEHKLAFRTRYGLFEPTVMQFGTINAPADLEGYINTTIKEALDDFALAYLDNILIFSDTEEEHVRHVKWVMQRLLEVGLYIKPEQCKCHKETVQYLGLIISTNWILMDEDKV